MHVGISVINTALLKGFFQIRSGNLSRGPVQCLLRRQAAAGRVLQRPAERCRRYSLQQQGSSLEAPRFLAEMQTLYVNILVAKLNS